MVAGDTISESDAEIVTSYCYHRQRTFGWDDAGRNFDEMNHYDNVYGGVSGLRPSGALYSRQCGIHQCQMSPKNVVNVH